MAIKQVTIIITMNSTMPHLLSVRIENINQQWLSIKIICLKTWMVLSAQ